MIAEKHQFDSRLHKVSVISSSIMEKTQISPNNRENNANYLQKSQKKKGEFRLMIIEKTRN